MGVGGVLEHLQSIGPGWGGWFGLGFRIWDEQRGARVFLDRFGAVLLSSSNLLMPNGVPESLRGRPSNFIDVEYSSRDIPGGAILSMSNRVPETFRAEQFYRCRIEFQSQYY